MIHRFLHLGALGIVENEKFLLSLSVVGHVQVLVLVEEGLEHSIVADALKTHLAELRQILLHCLHLQEDLLGVDSELSHNVVVALFVCKIVVALLDISYLAKRLDQFTSGGSDKSIEHFLKVTATRSSKYLKFL